MLAYQDSYPTKSIFWCVAHSLTNKQQIYNQNYNIFLKCPDRENFSFVVSAKRRERVRHTHITHTYVQHSM